MEMLIVKLVLGIMLAAVVAECVGTLLGLAIIKTTEQMVKKK